MKKFVILLILAWIGQSCCTTQYLVPLQNLDAIAGLGVSSNLGSKSWSPKMGGQIGVEAPLFRFTQSSSVVTGLGASFQGAAWEEEMYSGKVNTSYLNIPFLYTYESPGGFYGQAGLQPGFLLSAKDKYDEGSYDYKDNMNKFDLGFPLAAGFIINDKVRVGARANIGLINNSNYPGGNKDHNFTFNAVFNYRFNLPGKNSNNQ